MTANGFIGVYYWRCAQSTAFSLLQLHRRSSSDKDLYTVLKQTKAAGSDEGRRACSQKKLTKSLAALVLLEETTASLA
jgi:hypothetical protein